MWRTLDLSSTTPRGWTTRSPSVRLTGAYRRRRNRQLVAWVRRTANYVPPRGSLTTHRGFLIPERVVAVRSDLIEIAELLDQLEHPDPRCTAQLRQLLRDGCDSPLYNPELHLSELNAALYSVKARLAARPTGEQLGAQSGGAAAGRDWAPLGAATRRTSG